VCGVASAVVVAVVMAIAVAVDKIVVVVDCVGILTFAGSEGSLKVAMAKFEGAAREGARCYPKRCDLAAAAAVAAAAAAVDGL
jgi:predicted dinucleotide-utilizing enzyme